MCGLCESARLLAKGDAQAALDPTDQAFQSVMNAISAFDALAANSLISAGTNAAQLLTGSAVDDATVASIRAGIASFVATEPVQPSAPVAPATDTTRIGSAAYDFFDITTSQRVRIETRGGEDFVRLGNNNANLAITAVVIGGDAREYIEGRGAVVVGRFDLGGGADNLYGTFAAGSSINGLLGGGNDYVFLNTGTNYIDGGADDDNLTGGDGGDTLIGGSGNDTLYGEAVASFTVPAPGGNDLLFGGAGNDQIYAAGGDDQLSGGDGNDVLWGMWGNDRIWGGSGDDQLNGGDGDDILGAGSGTDTLSGWAGRDTLIAGEGTDTLYGGDGDDTLFDYGNGTGTLVGGNGNDRYIITSNRTTILDFNNEGTDDVAFVYVDGWTPPSGIERVIYMGGAAPPSAASLALRATSFRPEPNVTTTFRYIFVEAPYNQSKDGSNTFEGFYLPQGESLQMVALDQNFRLAFRQAANEYERVANIRFVEVTSLSEADFAVGAHNMTFGGYASLGIAPGDRFIDQLMISDTVSTSGMLRGQFAHDLMLHELGHIVGLKHPFEGDFQLAGPDSDNGRYTQMSYGSGSSSDGLMIFDIEAARLIYGTRATATGNDVYRFDQANRYLPGLVDDGGIDVIDLSGNANAATLDLRAGSFSSVNLDSFSLNNMPSNLAIANGTIIENAIGTSLADRITGNSADNRIEGGAGDDILDGGAGRDTASYASATAAVSVNLRMTAAQNTLGAGTDTLTSFENLRGSGFNDVLTGNDLDNTIEGGAGNDVLEGGGGTDTAVFSAARSAITFTRNADGSVTINAGADGSDRLTNIEQLFLRDTMFTLARFANPGGPRVENFTSGAGGWASQDQFPRQIADVNGDGFADVVGFGQAGTLVALGSASGNFAAPMVALANFGASQGWSSDNTFRRELADVNGDGRDDVVGFGASGVLVALAQANGSFGAVSLASGNFNPANGWSSQDGFARTLADVNGDGLADIVGFGTPGTFVALGSAGGSFGSATLALANFGVQQGWASGSVFHRELADVNGDGRADIVGFGTAGTLVALGQANGTFATPALTLANFGTNQGWSTQDGFTRDVGDVNGDGRDDVVGFGLAGTFVAYGQANGTFSAAAFELANFGRDQGWTSDNTFYREIADFNGDGRDDIFGFGFSGVFVASAFDGVVI